MHWVNEVADVDGLCCILHDQHRDLVILMKRML